MLFISNFRLRSVVEKIDEEMREMGKQDVCEVVAVAPERCLMKNVEMFIDFFLHGSKI